MPTNFNVDRAMAVIRNEHRKLLTLTFTNHFIYSGQFLPKRGKPSSAVSRAQRIAILTHQMPPTHLVCRSIASRAMEPT